MRSNRFTPEDGKIYKNQGGGTFRCLHGFNQNAVMVNLATGWTLKAHGCQMYADGTIEWDYSTGGHFDPDFRKEALA